jgi:hypothetical protein
VVLCKFISERRLISLIGNFGSKPLIALTKKVTWKCIGLCWSLKISRPMLPLCFLSQIYFAIQRLVLPISACSTLSFLPLILLYGQCLLDVSASQRNLILIEVEWQTTLHILVLSGRAKYHDRVTEEVTCLLEQSKRIQSNGAKNFSYIYNFKTINSYISLLWWLYMSHFY